MISYNDKVFDGDLAVLRLTDGSTTNAIGNYSASPTNFGFTPSPSLKVAIKQICVMIGDNATFSLFGYGAQITALTVGVNFSWQSNGVATSATLNPFKTNADYLSVATNTIKNNFSASDETLQYYLNFDSVSSVPIIIDGAKGDYFRATLNDNFSFLIWHQFTILGSSI